MFAKFAILPIQKKNLQKNAKIGAINIKVVA